MNQDSHLTGVVEAGLNISPTNTSFVGHSLKTTLCSLSYPDSWLAKKLSPQNNIISSGSHHNRGHSHSSGRDYIFASAENNFNVYMYVQRRFPSVGFLTEGGTFPNWTVSQVIDNDDSRTAIRIYLLSQRVDEQPELLMYIPSLSTISICWEPVWRDIASALIRRPDAMSSYLVTLYCRNWGLGRLSFVQ